MLFFLTFHLLNNAKKSRFPQKYEALKLLGFFCFVLFFTLIMIQSVS